MRTLRTELREGALAIRGGKPVRQEPLPYGRQSLDGEDIAAVVEALRSEWLTTGPLVDRFESRFAELAGVRFAVALSSGTAALHAAAAAIGVGSGDEVIVPSMTFSATANCVAFCGGRPVFADVRPETLLIDVEDVKRRINSSTKAVIAVDYAGQPCDYDALGELTARRGITLLDDACHAVGGSYKGRPVGSLATLNTFSFHPVKHLTTGEGGIVTTDDPELARRMQVFRNHGITTDHRQRSRRGAHFYEMVDLGYNYRLSDLQCALGLSQLKKLEGFVRRRREIATSYDRAFDDQGVVRPLKTSPDVRHAYHLYMVRLELNRLRVDRDTIFDALRAEGIGVNVHYIPVHLHPFYRRRYGTAAGDCPVAESEYRRLLTLPMFPAMSDDDVTDVIRAVKKVTGVYGK